MNINQRELTHLRLQAECWQWHWNTYVEDRPYIRLIHNNPRNKIDGAQLKAAGLRKGTPDMVWWRDHSIGDVYFEFKVGKDKQKPEQLEVEKILTNHGHWYFIITSVEEYTAAIHTLKHIQKTGAPF